MFGILNKKKLIREQQEKELFLKKEIEEKELVLKKEAEEKEKLLLKKEMIEYYNNTITDDFIMDKMAIESEELVNSIITAFKDDDDFLNRRKLYKLGIENCNPLKNIISDEEIFSKDYNQFEDFKLNVIELNKYLALNLYKDIGHEYYKCWLIDNKYESSPTFFILDPISYSDSSQISDFLKVFSDKKDILFENIKRLVIHEGIYLKGGGYKPNYYPGGGWKRESNIIYVEINFHQYNIKNLGGFLY